MLLSCSEEAPFRAALGAMTFHNQGSQIHSVGESSQPCRLPTRNSGALAPPSLKQRTTWCLIYWWTRIASHSEVIRAILIGDGPCCGGIRLSVH